MKNFPEINTCELATFLFDSVHVDNTAVKFEVTFMFVADDDAPAYLLRNAITDTLLTPDGMTVYVVRATACALDIHDYADKLREKHAVHKLIITGVAS